MRPITNEFAARLGAETAALAHLWRITRQDASVFGFTDHDRPLSALGLAFQPGAALAGGAIEASLGLDVDTASAQAALQSDLISEADLAAGLWDGARLDIFLCDWTAPEHSVLLFSGTLGEARRGPHAFEVEIRGPQALLQRTIGRLYSAQCDAVLGDARCGVDLAAPAFRGEGVVGALVSERAFHATGLGAFAEGWFSGGRLAWASGGYARVQTHRGAGEGALLELAAPPGVPLQPGAAFTVTAGCDRQFATCRAKFANTLNFRGMPHMPGPDALLQSAPASTRNDGGARGRP